eukprot:891932_1
MTQLQRMLYLLFILYMARIDATPQIIFDPHDPIASHPHMQQVVQEIVAQHHDNRRHLADVITSLSTDNKRAILDAHNNIRSLTARGKIETNSGSSKKACGMNKVGWSDLLHSLAQDWADACYYEHSDGCKDRIAKKIQRGYQLYSKQQYPPFVPMIINI